MILWVFILNLKLHFISFRSEEEEEKELKRENIWLMLEKPKNKKLIKSN